MDDQDANYRRLSREKRARISRRRWAAYKPDYSVPDINPYRQAHAAKVKQIDDVLEEYLRTPLVCAEAYFGAGLIYNDDEGPIWYLDRNQHGKRETALAIAALRQAEQVLVEEEAYLVGATAPIDVYDLRKRLAAYLASIPAPGNLMFDVDLFNAPRQKIHRLVSAYRGHLERQAPHQGSGNALADRTALSLRAVYEHYLKKPVTCGKYTSGGGTVLSGVYCRCLEEIFEIINVKTEVFARAQRAKSRPETDRDLRFYRQCLAENSQFDEDLPLLFSEVGWVENVTPEQKRINSMAMNDKRLEYMLCYTKCSMETGSTMTLTKS